MENLWHYLDDFILCGAADSEQCQLDLGMLIDICRHLGVPLAMEKLEGPTVRLIFLGIVIDTIAGKVKASPGEVEKVVQLVREWLHKKRCTKRAGQLQHAATVVRSAI